MNKHVRLAKKYAPKDAKYCLFYNLEKLEEDYSLSLIEDELFFYDFDLQQLIEELMDPEEPIYMVVVLEDC